MIEATVNENESVSYRLLPGRTAISYAPLAAKLARCGLTLMALAVTITVVGIISDDVPIVLSVVVFWVGGLFGLGAMSASYASQLKEADELKYGYTTLWNDHQEVPQLHPSTGKPIRAADEPLLSRDEFIRRREAGYSSQTESRNLAESLAMKPRQWRRRSKLDLLTIGLTSIGVTAAVIVKLHVL